MNVNEFAQPYAEQSRLRDTTELIDNESTIIREFLSYLGLEYDREGNLVRTKINGNYADQMINVQGATRVINTHLRPYMSRLGDFTNLSKEEIYREVRNFSNDLIKYLIINKYRFSVSTADARQIGNKLATMVFLQLSRSREGENNLMLQVMGNMTKQVVVREGENDYHQYPQESRRGWGMGLFRR